MNAFARSDLPPEDPASATEGEAGPHKRDLIAGLEKGLAVIEAFDQDRPRLTISEVATRCNLTRAAARRYLITLEYLGYVTSDRRMYSLSPKVLRLGQSYMHSARLPRVIQPQLQKLAYALQEASSAGCGRSRPTSAPFRRSSNATRSPATVITCSRSWRATSRA